MPKIDYKTRDFILKEYGERELAEFERLTYADRYLYKQYIFKKQASPSEWVSIVKFNKIHRGQYQKLFDKESSEFNADEIAKELEIETKKVWDIYYVAIKKIRKIISENPQKYNLLREYLKDFDK